MIRASDATDAGDNQNVEYDYKHYMRKPKQSKEDAIADAEKFIENQRENYLREPDRIKALEELGAGMHTLMDKTSPAHNGKHGPKLWDGGSLSKYVIFPFYHFYAEANFQRRTEDKVQEAVLSIRNYYLDATKLKDPNLHKDNTPPSPEPSPAPVPPVPPPPKPVVPVAILHKTKALKAQSNFT